MFIYFFSFFFVIIFFAWPCSLRSLVLLLIQLNFFSLCCEAQRSLSVRWIDEKQKRTKVDNSFWFVWLLFVVVVVAPFSRLIVDVVVIAAVTLHVKNKSQILKSVKRNGRQRGRGHTVVSRSVFESHYRIVFQFQNKNSICVEWNRKEWKKCWNIETEVIFISNSSFPTNGEIFLNNKIGIDLIRNVLCRQHHHLIITFFSVDDVFILNSFAVQHFWLQSSLFACEHVCARERAIVLRASKLFFYFGVTIFIRIDFILFFLPLNFQLTNDKDAHTCGRYEWTRITRRSKSEKWKTTNRKKLISQSGKQRQPSDNVRVKWNGKNEREKKREEKLEGRCHDSRFWFQLYISLWIKWDIKSMRAQCVCVHVFKW